MTFETLKRSHLKRNIIIALIAIGIISAIVLNFTRAKYRTTQSIPLINGTINYELSDFNLIGAYIQNGDDYTPTNEIPSSGYEFNVEKNTELNVTFVKDSLEYVSPSYAKTVLDVAQTGIEWDNIEDSDDQDSQQPSDSDPGNDSDKTDEENSSQVIQAENNTSTSQSQTGDHTDILGYVYLALGSLTAVLYLMKRRYQKTH